MSDAPPPQSWPPPSTPPPSEPTEPSTPPAPPAPTEPVAGPQPSSATPAPAGFIPPAASPGPAIADERHRNGLAVAVLVLGVASLVAAISFVLFPLGLIGGLVGVILGIVAIARARTRSTNTGPAVGGLICSAIALMIAIGLTVQVGTWVARNTSVFTRFDTCIAKANGRADVANCIARFANDVRP